MDFFTLSTMRKTHPGWRLLMADNAPLIAGFLHREFILPNVRAMAQEDVAAKLEDELFRLRESEGREAFPRRAGEYLDEWARNDKGWLRKFYPPGTDEAHFDLTPAAEKAIAWLESLTQRIFVGTESRLMTVFALLRQMAQGTETDPETRLAELEKRKAEIERRIVRLRRGELDLLDDIALKDRFQQVGTLARELLGDFREVEHNFRQLDRQVREQIAAWEGRKGELLARIFGERDVIADSDQGRSFRAFWDFLMSPERQEEFSGLLEKIFSLEAIASLHPDPRLKRIHYDWLEAGEDTQRTVAHLSQQLRRYLDDQAYLENRRIIQLLQGIETAALAVREAAPEGTVMEIDEPGLTVQLPMERPLYSPPIRPALATEVLAGDGAEIAANALFEQVLVDKARLQANLQRLLQTRTQVTLREVLDSYPSRHGLAEIVAYLALAGADPKAIFDDNESEQIMWQDRRGVPQRGTLPRVIFSR